MKVHDRIGVSIALRGIKLAFLEFVEWLNGQVIHLATLHFGDDMVKLEPVGLLKGNTLRC